MGRWWAAVVLSGMGVRPSSDYNFGITRERLGRDDEMLKFDNHTEAHVNKVIGLLHRAFETLDWVTRVLFTALVGSHLEYCKIAPEMKKDE